MSKYKKQHYLSQCYLKWFQTNILRNWFKSEGCYFWNIFKNPTWDLTWKIFSSIENLAYKNHLFSFVSYEWESKIYQPTLEIEFGKFEWAFSILLKNLSSKYNIFCKTKNIDDFHRINEQEKILLAEFFKFQFKRSLKAHNSFDKDIEKLYYEILDSQEIKDKFWLERKQALINNWSFKDSLIKNGGVQSMVNLFSSNNLNNILLKKNWYFLIITDNNKSFVTSDFPIYRFNEKWKSNWIIEKSTQITLPLTGKIALLMHWDWWKTIYKIFNDNNYIKRVNWMSVANANNLVISSNLKLLKKIVWFKLNKWKYSYDENKYFNLKNK